jgi:catechol 2,3-dioxygenase-like lactoylglutathione lyase family enzyme
MKAAGPGTTLTRLRLGVGALTLTLLLTIGLLAPSASAQGAPAAVVGVESVGMTVSDMDRALDFYTGVLAFEMISDVEVVGAARSRSIAAQGPTHLDRAADDPREERRGGRHSGVLLPRSGRTRDAGRPSLKAGSGAIHQARSTAGGGKPCDCRQSQGLPRALSCAEVSRRGGPGGARGTSGRYPSAPAAGLGSRRR